MLRQRGRPLWRARRASRTLRGHDDQRDPASAHLDLVLLPDPLPCPQPATLSSWRRVGVSQCRRMRSTLSLNDVRSRCRPSDADAEVVGHEPADGTIRPRRRPGRRRRGPRRPDRSPLTSLRRARGISSYLETLVVVYAHDRDATFRSHLGHPPLLGLAFRTTTQPAAAPDVTPDAGARVIAAEPRSTAFRAPWERSCRPRAPGSGERRRSGRVFLVGALRRRRCPSRASVVVCRSYWVRPCGTRGGA